PDQRVLRLGQHAVEVLFGERGQLHADGQAALQLRKQVRRLDRVESAAADEQNVVGVDVAVLGGHGGSLQQRQQVALHAFAAGVGTLVAVGGRGDLVDLVQENNAVLRGAAQRLRVQLLAAGF